VLRGISGLWVGHSGKVFWKRTGLRTSWTATIPYASGLFHSVSKWVNEYVTSLITYIWTYTDNV